MGAQSPPRPHIQLHRALTNWWKSCSGSLGPTCNSFFFSMVLEELNRACPKLTTRTMKSHITSTPVLLWEKLYSRIPALTLRGMLAQAHKFLIKPRIPNWDSSLLPVCHAALFEACARPCSHFLPPFSFNDSTDEHALRSFLLVSARPCGHFLPPFSLNDSTDEHAWLSFLLVCASHEHVLVSSCTSVGFSSNNSALTASTFLLHPVVAWFGLSLVRSPSS